ncbi:hypothetical protein ACWDZW_07950, partial [Streptomyces coeruleorubidus]
RMADPRRDRLSAAVTRAAPAPAMPIAPPSRRRPTAWPRGRDYAPESFRVMRSEAGSSAENDRSCPKVVPEVPDRPLTRKRFELTVPFEVTSTFRYIEHDSKGRAWDDLT